MQAKAQQILSASILALALVFGATACTATGPASSGDAGGQSAPAQALKDTVTSIQEYAKSDMNPQEGQETTPAEDKVNAHFDPSMDATKRSDVVSIFAEILSIDPNATIDVEPGGIQVDGEKAVINADDLKVTIRGQEQVSGGGGGTITLRSQSGKWLVADISFPEEAGDEEGNAPSDAPTTAEDLS